MRVFLIIAVSLVAFAIVAAVSDYIPAHVFTVPQRDSPSACSITAFKLTHTTTDSTTYAYTVFTLTSTDPSKCSTGAWPVLHSSKVTLSSIQVPLSGFPTVPSLSFTHAAAEKSIRVVDHSSITFALRTKRTCKKRYTIDLSLPNYPTNSSPAAKFCPTDIVESPLASS